MSDDAQKNPEKTPSGESPPLEPQPGTATPNPKDFKYTADDGVPSWAVDKTPGEVLEMTKTLYDAVVSGEGVKTPQPQSTPQPQAQTMQPNVGGPPDTNLLYTNPEEYNRQLSAWNQNQIQTAFQTQATPYLQGMVELARNESKRDSRFKDVWGRYAPEIEATAATVNPQMKTNVTFWNDVASLIKGRHAEDIFKTRLAENAPLDTGTMGGGGGVASGTGTSNSAFSPIERAWRDDADWIQQFKRLPGMTLGKLRAQVSSMGNNEEDYVKHYESKVAMRIHRSDEEITRYGGVL